MAQFGEAYRELSDESLAFVDQPSRRLDRVTDDLLKPMLVPRVAGTAGNARVRDTIVEHFVQLGWHVELDTFNDTTPFGIKTFSNVIATKDPRAPSRLVLSAHYDSKYYPDFAFIGATDSAAPCAVLLDLAWALNDTLPTEGKAAAGTTLQLIFFDGEEAFVKWSDTDSTYGARHLADKWDHDMMITRRLNTLRAETILGQIEVLVLLDLLGTTNPRIPNYFPETDSLYRALVRLEARLMDAGILEAQSELSPSEGLRSIFDTESPRTFQNHVMSDDHVPFLNRGVNILHLIPSPFPFVWHTEFDNPDCIDPPVVRNLARLFRGFVLEYLEIDPSS
ncbi:putative glutaminyl cyclase [Dichotomocladium elegans]|nr:putative glutaminyl cyclase [Dichotomocladium elegans]